MQRTLIVGDIHGCLAELEDLIAAAGISKKTDQLISVGDTVAKGPESHGVLKLLRDWSARAVKGNHDAHVLKFRRGEEKEMKKEHRSVARSLSENDWQYLEALPLFLRLPGIIVVHGGALPG